MKHELKRVDPLRAANVSALVYGLLLFVFMLIFSPVVFVVSLFSPTENFAFGAVFAVMMLLLYPIIGLVMGWISGLLSAAIYNLVIRWTGGLLVELSRVDVAPAANVEGA